MFLSNLSPAVAGRLAGRGNLVRVIANIGWLAFDKVLRYGVNFVLLAWIARYLGVETFGLWNYAIAFVALFSMLNTLGLDSIVVKHLVAGQRPAGEVLGSALALRLIGSGLAVGLATGAIALVRPEEPALRWLVGLTAAGFLFQAFDTIDLYFQAQLKSRYPVVARNVAFLLSAAVRVGLLLGGYPVVAFAAASVLELALAALFMSYVYRREGQSFRQWRVNWPTVSLLGREGMPLMLTGMVILIYMRTDQVMLGSLAGDAAVGIFSVAVRLSEVWYFIPLIITNSTLPAMLEARKAGEAVYLKKMQQLYDGMAWLGFGTALVLSLLATPLIVFVFGPDYAAAGPVLAVHAWTSAFVFIGFACGNWYVAEGLQTYLFYRSLYGAVVNVALNFWLIPRYGGLGAAIATLASQLVASYLANAFSAKTRLAFRMQTRSLWRIITLHPLRSLRQYLQQTT